jgi:hypothetical protein
MQENQEIGKQDISIKKPPLQSIYPTAINGHPTESIIEQPVVEAPKTNAKKTNYPGWYSVASFLSALIPIALWTYCLIQYHANANPNAYGTNYAGLVVSALPIAYYCSIGLPIAGFSISTGIRGLKSHLHRLASISLFLKLCTALLVLYFLFYK